MEARRRFQFGIEHLLVLTAVVAVVSAALSSVWQVSGMDGLLSIFYGVYAVGPPVVFMFAASRGMRQRILATCVTMVLLILLAEMVIVLAVLLGRSGFWPSDDPIEAFLGLAIGSIVYWILFIVVFSVANRLVDPPPRKSDEREENLIDFPAIRSHKDGGPGSEDCQAPSPH